MEIYVNNLTKKYYKNGKENVVLDKASINFEYGKLYMIVGKSGAGKTSFLKCLSLITNVNSGDIIINNKSISEFNDHDSSNFRNSTIGFVFQNYNLLDFLTVEENIILPALKNNNNTNKIKERAKKLLEYVNLEDRIDYYPSELSGGEQQRVAIARALINNPKIILADEPTGNVDNENKKHILELFKKLVNSNKCVIVVTHDNDILKYADEIYELSKGKLNKI